MSILSTIRGWFRVILKDRVKEELHVEAVSSPEVETILDRCQRIYEGRPDWVSEEDGIKTVNFAKAVCSETARLATLGIGIKIDGQARAKYIQDQINKIYYRLRDWVEYGCAYGLVILKPNGETVDLYTRGSFVVTHHTGGVIDGVVFLDQKKSGKEWYTRMEHHRFENGLYVITNRCFRGKDKGDTKTIVDIKDTPWAELEPEVCIRNVDKPLFGVLKMPHANNVDSDSPYSLPVFSDAVEELMDLDIAYSRNATEVFNSDRTVLLDEAMIAGSGRPVAKTIEEAQRVAKRIKLPNMAKMVRGDGKETYYQEINPELNTDARLTGINALLSQIGYKVGYSNGYFVFNESTGIQTATGVEAEQQRTIQLIKDVRDKLESCIADLVYAINVMADLYKYAPSGEYEIVFDFGDITYNREDDRARWWGYVVAGKVPAWRFFVKFEGMTEAEAKEMAEEVSQKMPKLFGDDE